MIISKLQKRSQVFAAFQNDGNHWEHEATYRKHLSTTNDTQNVRLPNMVWILKWNRDKVGLASILYVLIKFPVLWKPIEIQ